MRNANSVILLAVAAGTLAGCHTAPPTVSDNVMACGKIADTAQRYRCYDSLNTSMRPAPSARVANASPAPAAASAPAPAAPAAASVSAAMSAPTAPSQARAHEAGPAPQLQAGAVSAAPP